MMEENAKTLIMVNAEELQKYLMGFEERLLGAIAPKVEESHANEEFLRVCEVLETLNVCKSTLWKWERSGILKPIRRGKKVFYRKSDVRNMLINGN